MSNNSNIYTKDTIEFVTVSKEVMSFIETSSSLNREEYSIVAIKLFSLLYLKATNLPVTTPIDTDNAEKFITEDKWIYVKHNIEQKLGDWDDFIELRDATIMNSSDFINVSISELFADVYQDIGDLINTFRISTDESINDALYICKYNFKNYWGPRVLKILETLHAKLFFEKETEENAV